MSIRRRSSQAFVALTIALASSHPAFADDDGLEPYRDRFRLGMEKYKAGAMGEAIRVWGAIYEELGPHRGYRLAFDLGRAHDANGEATRAAERYTSFLDEVTRRRAALEPIEPLVEREEAQAADRLRELNRTHGRIQVSPGPGGELTQVDDADPRLGAFTAYVAPGAHVVVFRAGRTEAEKVDVTVGADELVTAAPSTPPVVAVPPPVERSFVPTVRERKPPFSPVLIYTAAGVTVASILAPALGYSRANTLYDRYQGLSNITPQEASASNTARTTAYALLALPIGFGAITTGLTVWYFTGGKQRDVPASLAVGMVPGGGVATVRGVF